MKNIQKQKNKKEMEIVTNVNQLFSADVHLGHNIQEWNSKMLPYLHSIQNNRHIIDLEKSLPLLRRAIHFLKTLTSQNEKVLFIGTKNSEISQITKIAALFSNQSYINTRWVHGTLSNWNSISHSIAELNEFEEKLKVLEENWKDKKSKNVNSRSELLSSSFSPSVRRRYKRLKYLFDGVRNLTELPSALVILDDLNNHKLVVREAIKQRIAVIGILDSNSDPYGIDYPIPGNDDSLKSIHLYAELLAKASYKKL